MTMTSVRFSTVVLVLAAGSGCHGSEPVNPITVESTDSSGVQLTEITGAPDSLPVLGLDEDVRMQISGSTAPYLSSIGEGVWLSDGRVILEDNQSDELHLFSETGAYLKLLGSRGDGPGEFEGISSVSVGSADTVYAYDARHGRVSILHPDTGFVRSLPLRLPPDDRFPVEAWRLENGRFVAYTETPLPPVTGPSPRSAPRRGTLSLHDEAGRVIDEVTFPAGFSIETEVMDIFASYSNRPVIAVEGNRISYSSGESYQISILDGELDLRQRIRWPELTEPIDSNEIDSVRATAARWYATAGAPRERARSLAAAIVAVVPPSRPPLGRLMTDDQGRLWVRGFEPDAPGWLAERRWQVLDERGRPLGALVLSPRTTLMAISGSLAMVAVLDSLDVPRLEVREITGL